MRRSTLIVVGYAGFGVLFLINAVTGAGFRSTMAINVERRMITWGVLGVIWLLVSAYGLLRPEQFDNRTGDQTDQEIGYAFMFSVVFVMLLVLSAGVLLNLIMSII